MAAGWPFDYEGGGKTEASMKWRSAAKECKIFSKNQNLSHPF